VVRFTDMQVLLLLLSFLAAVLGVARAEDATAILKVRSNVVGAEVYLDGEKLGVTPLTKYLAPGTHQVRVVADRHDPFVRKVELVKDTTFDLQAQLVAGTGTLEFTGPSGARLLLDGVDRGALPIRLPSPAAGTHRWKVVQPGSESAEGAVEVVAGRNHLVPVALETSRGVVVVGSRPEGARVRLDGADVGVTPLRLKGVAPGKHAVEVALDGHARAIRALDTSGGGRGELDVTLQKGGATLVLATGAADAKVYGNEVLLGSGSTVRVEGIERGRLKVRVEGGAVASGVVTVPAEGVLDLRVAGESVVERRSLVTQWPFWAGVGGVVVAGGATAAAVVVANQPEPVPLPTGATVVVLP
jgi:hypothetical protein